MGIIYFVVLLGIIVTVHELGHFVAAKCFGVYVGEFSIGMGPKLFSFQGKETTYSIRLLPIGGFVSMAGETENELESAVNAEVPLERTIKGIHRGKQIIIMIAGILMNLLLAWVLFTSIVYHQGFTEFSDVPVVGSVVENSPAEKAGFMVNDEIIKIEFLDHSSIEPDSFSSMSTFSKGKETMGRTYTLKRGEKLIEIYVEPTYFEDSDAYLIGIGATYIQTQPTFIQSAVYGFSTMKEVCVLIVDSLLDLFKGKNLDQLSGPVGIYTVAKEQASLGMLNYIWLIAVLSLNIGIFNALPLPILDGGRALLACVEIILRKPINKKVEEIMMSICVILLLGLMVFATCQDVIRMIIK